MYLTQKQLAMGSWPKISKAMESGELLSTAEISARTGIHAGRVGFYLGTLHAIGVVRIGGWRNHTYRSHETRKLPLWQIVPSVSISERNA